MWKLKSLAALAVLFPPAVLMPVPVGAANASAASFGQVFRVAQADQPSTRDVIEAAKIDCVSDDLERAIAGCTVLIEAVDQPAEIVTTAYFNRGIRFVHRRADRIELERGVADLSEVISREPIAPRSLVARGNAYDILGDPDKALADYAEAIRQNPDFPAAYLERAVTYQNLGKTDLAIADLESALMLVPGDVKVVARLSQSYADTGQPDKAEATIEAAIEHAPQSAELYWLRAVLNFQTDNKDLVPDDICKVLEFDPSNANALEAARGFTLPCPLPQPTQEEASNYSNQFIAYEYLNITATKANMEIMMEAAGSMTYFVTLDLQNVTINSESAEAFRRAFASRLELYEAESAARGFADLAGSYAGAMRGVCSSGKLDLASLFSHTDPQTGEQQLTEDWNIWQEGPRLSLVGGEGIASADIGLPGRAVGDVAVFGTWLDLGFSFWGKVVGETIEIRLMGWQVKAAMLSWQAPEEDWAAVEDCVLVLTPR